MIDYTIILSTNYTDKQWSLIGDSYEGLDWLDSSPKPTKDELDALWPATQITAANKQADQKRHADYIAEADPLFFKSQRGEATIEEWEAKVTEIKNRYPKQ
jgi:ABC-type Fe3+-hydroxamate transport system substrate-binding protein